MTMDPVNPERVCFCGCEGRVRTVSVKYMPFHRTGAVRFWEKVEVEGDCWIWKGATSSHGHGRFSLGPRGSKKDWAAHRWAYEYLIGPIDTGLVLDHLCRNPPCVNPGHLEPVTQGENLRRAYPHAYCNWTEKITHCPHGHPYNESNTYWYGNKRICKTCTRDRGLRRTRR